MLQFDTGNNTWQKLQSLIMQLRKCCNHPYLFPGAEPDFDGINTGARSRCPHSASLPHSLLPHNFPKLFLYTVTRRHMLVGRNLCAAHVRATRSLTTGLPALHAALAGGPVGSQAHVHG